MRTRSIFWGIWTLVIIGVAVAAATGAIDGFGPRVASGPVTTATILVPPPADPAVAPAEVVPAPPPPPPPAVDRTGEYLEAMVADTMEGFDEAARPVVTCVSQGILSALGGASALEAAGVSPQLFGVADDLTELGIPIDAGVVDAVAASATSCGLGPWIAQLLVGGFSELLTQVGSTVFGMAGSSIVDEADAACLRDRSGGDPRLVGGFSIAYVLADQAAADQAFAATFGAALTDCPHTFVPFFLEAARASGYAPAAEGERCIEAEVVARADRLAGAFTGVSPQDAETVSIEVFRACEGALAG